MSHYVGTSVLHLSVIEISFLHFYLIFCLLVNHQCDVMVYSMSICARFYFSVLALRCANCVLFRHILFMVEVISCTLHVIVSCVRRGAPGHTILCHYSSNCYDFNVYGSSTYENKSSARNGCETRLCHQFFVNNWKCIKSQGWCIKIVFKMFKSWFENHEMWNDVNSCLLSACTRS